VNDSSVTVTSKEASPKVTLTQFVLRDICWLFSSSELSPPLELHHHVARSSRSRRFTLSLLEKTGFQFHRWEGQSRYRFSKYCLSWWLTLRIMKQLGRSLYEFASNSSLPFVTLKDNHMVRVLCGAKAFSSKFQRSQSRSILTFYSWMGQT